VETVGRRHIPEKVEVFDGMDGHWKAVTVEEAIEIWVKNSRIDEFTPYAPRMETILRKVQKALGCSREPAWRRVVRAVKQSDHLEWVVGDNNAHFLLYKEGEVKDKDKVRHVKLEKQTPTKKEESSIDIYAMLVEAKRKREEKDSSE